MRSDPSSPRSRANRPVGVSMMLGMILVPLSALAAFALVSPKAPEATEPTPTTAALDVSATVAAPTLDDDLAKACGPDGLELVAAELSGTITDIQQAGLDALREICADQGTPLPGPPALAPVVETVVVGGPTTSTRSASVSPVITDDDHDDDEDHDDDHDDDEDHDDDDDEDHGEDDD